MEKRLDPKKDEPSRFASPARSATTRITLGAYKFEAFLFPVFTVDEVTSHRKALETTLASATATPYVYAFPPAENPQARYGDSGEVPKTASKVIIQELDTAGIINVLIVCARYGSGTPRDALLLQAYQMLARNLLAACGRAPLSKRL